MSNYHLAILKQPYLNAILDGSKVVESRLTRTRREPFGGIGVGDKIFFKVSSGAVCAVGTVADVKSFSNLTPAKVVGLKEEYNHLVLGGDDYWLSKADSRFAVFVWLKDVYPIEPILISKKDWRAWVVLTEKQNFGLLGG
ncbi:ASCH domain-containing protein [Planctomycetota bacterium]